MWFHTLYHNTYKDIIYAALKKSIDWQLLLKYEATINPQII